MKALVYHGAGLKAWEEVARPALIADTDAIVRVDTTTICGTDLHILKGDLPAMVDGRDRCRGEERGCWRPGLGVVCVRLWPVPVLPRGSFRSVHRRRWMDSRQR